MEINLEAYIARLKSEGIDTAEAETYLEDLIKEKTAPATGR